MIGNASNAHGVKRKDRNMLAECTRQVCLAAIRLRLQDIEVKTNTYNIIRGIRWTSSMICSRLQIREYIWSSICPKGTEDRHGSGHGYVVNVIIRAVLSPADAVPRVDNAKQKSEGVRKSSVANLDRARLGSCSR